MEWWNRLFELTINVPIIEVPLPLMIFLLVAVATMAVVLATRV